MTRLERLSSLARRPLAVAAIALVLGAAIAVAEDDGDGAPPSGAKTEIRPLERAALDLSFRVVDLAYGAEKIAGGPGKLAGTGDSLAGKVEAIAIRETATEVKIELSGDILFDFDRATLRPEAEPALQKAGEVIRRYGKPKIRVEGFTDSKGDAAYNRKLSERRADTVKDWLVRNKLTGSVLSTRGWGEEKPVAPNERPDGSDDPQGRQKNRRVEITVQKS